MSATPCIGGYVFKGHIDERDALYRWICLQGTYWWEGRPVSVDMSSRDILMRGTPCIGGYVFKGHIDERDALYRWICLQGTYWWEGRPVSVDMSSRDILMRGTPCIGGYVFKGHIDERDALYRWIYSCLPHVKGPLINRRPWLYWYVPWRRVSQDVDFYRSSRNKKLFLAGKRDWSIGPITLVISVVLPMLRWSFHIDSARYVV